MKSTSSSSIEHLLASSKIDSRGGGGLIKSRLRVDLDDMLVRRCRRFGGGEAYSGRTEVRGLGGSNLCISRWLS